MSTCIFCDIVARKEEARIVYQDEEVTAFHDAHPVAPVHVLIVPNEHVDGVASVGAEDAPVLGKLMVVARHVAQEQGVEGYRLVVNNGRQAGQSVFHLHMHLLGGRSMRWPPG